MRNSWWAVVLLSAAALLDGCSMGSVRAGSIVAGGDAQRGAASISRYGCGSCHTIGGIAAAHGLVGPPLTGLRNRMYVAGMLPNTADNLMHWIRQPKLVNPKTAMPELGVSPSDAADIAAYIYSIP
jgi:cytochrome c2